MKRFLLQAVTDEDHLAPARELFGLDGVEFVAISTAFMTASGLSLLQDVLTPIANRTRLFVGIRNGVTTVQSVQMALDVGCETYMVDTGTRDRIFHPKLYYARSAVRAKLLLGSANLTMGGLRANIEASVMQELDPVADAGFIADLEGKLDAMITDYPAHVIRATDSTQLADMLLSGRLIDERKARLREPVGVSADRTLDTVPRMDLRTAPLHVARPAAPPAPRITPATPAAPVAQSRAEQVWESRGLVERDLQIPTGDNTSPAGSMLMKLGAWTDIDHQFYFREEVFSALDWVFDEDPRRAHWERALGVFRLIIKGIDYGEHALKLSHDTRDTERIRRARNSKTQLHWGRVKPLVARRDLLGGTLRLFRETKDPARFTLEID